MPKAAAVIALVAGLALTFARSAGAQSSGPIDPARLSDITRELASDRFAGRAPGGPGEAVTIDYISSQFKALGLEPAGDNGGWTQKVALIRTRLSGPVALSLTTGAGSLTLLQGQDTQVMTLRPVDQVKIDKAPLVFVGYGVTAPERGWDDFKGVDLKGKIAVFLIGDPDLEAAPGEPVAGKFGGSAATYYARWTYKYEEAVRRGRDRRADRPREPRGRLWLDDGQGLERRGLRHRPRRSGEGKAADAGLDPARRGGRSVQALGPGFRGPEALGPHGRVQARGPDRRDLVGRLRRRATGRWTAPTSWRACRAQASGRDRDLRRPLGRLRRRRARRPGKHHPPRRRRRRHRRGRGDRGRPRLRRRVHARTARSCSPPGPPRSAGCWARNTTPTTRPPRWARRSPTTPSTSCRPWVRRATWCWSGRARTCWRTVSPPSRQTGADHHPGRQARAGAVLPRRPLLAGPSRACRCCC
jgi:hypothetical protein